MSAIRRITVIGAGTMGLGVTECFALAGLEVKLLDATTELSRQALDRLFARVQGHITAGLLPDSAMERTRKGASG